MLETDGDRHAHVRKAYLPRTTSPGARVLKEHPFGTSDDELGLLGEKNQEKPEHG